MFERIISKLLERAPVILIVIGVGVLLIWASGGLSVVGAQILFTNNATSLVVLLVALTMVASGIVILIKSDTKLNRGVSNRTAQRCEFRSIQLEHNAYWQGAKGMWIHMDFIIYGARGIPCKSVAFFYNSTTGEPLADTNNAYASTNGKVCVSTRFKPKRQRDWFDDLSMFMPYRELHLGPGSYNLRLYVVLRQADTEKYIGESEWVYLRMTN